MAKATAIFDGDDSRLGAVIDRIDKKLRDMQGQFSRVMGFATKVLALPTAAAVGLGAGIKAALDAGGELSDVSANTGIAVGDLMALRQEFKNAGKAAEDVPTAIAKMQKALTADTAGKTVSALGLDLAKLRGQTPIDQFHALGKAINGIQDPAARASASMEIFGKSGASLLAMFASTGFGDAAAQVGTQAAIMNRDAALFDSISDKLALAGVKVQGFFVGVADKVAPLLNPLLDKFAALDLAAMGQQVGDVIAYLIQSFSDGTIWGTLLDGGLATMMRIGNFLAGALAAVGAGWWQYMQEFWGGLGSLGGALVQFLGDGFTSIALRFGALLLDGAARMLDALAQVPGFGKAATWATAARATGLGLQAAAGASDPAAGFAASLDAIAQQMSGAIERIGAEAGAAFEKGSSVFDVAAVEDRIAAQVDAAMKAVEKTTAAQLAANPTAPGGKGTGDLAGEIANGAVGTLQKVGLDAYGGGYDPQLEESRTQTGLMRAVDKTLQGVRSDLKPLGRLTGLQAVFS